ncbi:LPS export ABC transporter permease LptG [Rhodospirillum centenum]|uniref:Predicted permease YjgP n=1 Tax=Rhodospirillum centenum (strain ATCC 51521 / SW) TaxID=414684 RepID=B6IN70_RHOCS|nr:LPS export ABC transporter permease LptG [Rhodospirillum centenum]ACI98967.1 predicted permease YjgP [Rhodospirillum centenum SW]
MRLSATLSLYIGRQFVLWFLAILGGMLAIVYLLDTVELLRRAANKPDAAFQIVLTMGLLKLPEIGQEIVPFVVLFGGMYTFWRLTRTQELVVVRASGISVWQFMAPVLTATFLIGMTLVGVLNPIFSAMLGRYEQLENRYLRGMKSSLDVAESGIWLRQVGEPQAYLIHADAIVPGTLELRQVMVLLNESDGQVSGRFDAASATLRDGFWELRDAWFNRPGRVGEFLPAYRLPTELTEQKIQEAFASPDTLSFWELPGFIATLEATGLSSVRHRLHWHSLLAQPVLLCAMILLAAAFAMRQVRRGGALTLIALGIAAALLLFVMQDIVLALGMSGTIPVLLAAWAPAGVSVMLGAAALLHLEDG